MVVILLTPRLQYSLKIKIINQEINLHLQCNISKATKYYQQLISQDCNDHRIFANYGVILSDLGKLQEATYSYRKEIEL